MQERPPFLGDNAHQAPQRLARLHVKDPQHLDDGAVSGDRLTQLRADVESLRAVGPDAPATAVLEDTDRNATGELPFLDLPLPVPPPAPRVYPAPAPRRRDDGGWSPSIGTAVAGDRWAAALAVDTRPPALPPPPSRKRGRVPRPPRRPLLRPRAHRPPRFARPLPITPLPQQSRFLPPPRFQEWGFVAVLVGTLLGVVAVAQMIFRIYVATTSTSSIFGADPVAADWVIAAGGVVGGALTVAVGAFAIGIARGQLRWFAFGVGVVAGFGLLPYEIYAATGGLADPPLPPLRELIVPPGWDRPVQLRAAFVLMVVALVIALLDLIVRWALLLGRMGTEGVRGAVRSRRGGGSAAGRPPPWRAGSSAPRRRPKARAAAR